MSVIAHLLLRRGAVVSGSDAAASSTVVELREAGASISVGHDGSTLPQQDAVVVVSSAIRDDNLELVMARSRGLRIAHRAEALAWLMDGYRAICVAGTAGKTSTTSMLGAALQGAGLDPSYAVGGQLRSSGSGAHLGNGDVFVAEADESDSSFLRYSPTVAVVTNLEPDHLDHYGTAEAYTAAFDEFAAQVVQDGTLIVCADAPGAQALGVRAGQNGVRVLQYGRAASGFDDARLLEFSSQGGAGRLRFSFRGRSSSFSCRCPASTWRQMRWLRSWRVSVLARRSRACLRDSPATTACGAGSS
nr:Mur ligase family protein [Kineosporia sp. NBRC 101677]